MPTIAETQNQMTNDTSQVAEQGSFGRISLLTEGDTIPKLDLPMQRGFSTLELTPEDMGDTIYVDSSQKTVDTSFALAQDVKTDTIIVSQDMVTTAPQEKKVENTRPLAEFDEKVLRINYTKVGDIENGWMFWALLLSLVVLGVSKLIFPKRTGSSLFTYVFNYNFAQKEFYKAVENYQFVTFLMECLFSFNIGLFTFFALREGFGWEVDQMQAIVRTLILTVFFFAIYFLKKLFYLFVANIFDKEEYARECNFNVYLYNSAIMVCLYPLLIALAFLKTEIISTNTLLIIGYCIIGFFYILRLFREFQISRKNRVSVFYIFLYFCTLEILPILILVKIITSIVFAEFRAL